MWVLDAQGPSVFGVAYFRRMITIWFLRLGLKLNMELNQLVMSWKLSVVSFNWIKAGNLFTNSYMLKFIAQSKCQEICILRVYFRTFSPPIDKPVEAPEKPNVHIILFDSVSFSQFTRSLPKTRYILREGFEAIPFRHPNKVARNSRPNGFPLLMGKYF